MTYYTGIDVSLRSVSICVVYDKGEICLEAKVAAEIDAIVDRLRRFSSDVRAGDFVSGSFMRHADRHLLTKRRPKAFSRWLTERRHRRATLVIAGPIACGEPAFGSWGGSRLHPDRADRRCVVAGLRCIRQITPPASNAS